MRRKLVFLALLAAVALFSIGTLYSVIRLQDEQHALGVRANAAEWLVVSLERELTKLLPLVESLVSHPGRADVDAAVTQFEVLWSRVSLLGEGAEVEPIRDLPTLHSTTAALRSVLAEAEPHFQALAEGRSVTLPGSIHEAFAGLAAPVHEFLVAVHVENAWRVDFGRRVLAWDRTRLYASFAGILLSGLVLLGLLVREARAGARLLALSDAARGEAEAHATALAESERRFRDLVEGSVQGVYIHRDRRLLFANRAAAEMLGYDSVGELTAIDTVEALVAAHELERLREYKKARVHGQGAPTAYEFDGLRRDGSTVRLHNVTRVIEWEGEVAVQSTIIDVSDRHRAEEALRRLNEELEGRVAERTAAVRRSEARYRAVVEDQTEFVCRFLPDGTLTFVNDAYCNYFDKRREALEGHTFMPMIPDEDQAIVAGMLASIDADRPVVSYEHRVIRPGGEIRWQQWTDRALFGADGTIAEYQAVGRDVTDRKHAEEALAEARGRLHRKEKLELLGQLTGMVSHELRNPLGTLRTSIAGIRRLCADPEPTLAKLLELAERNVGRCNDIIGDLLDYASVRRLNCEATALDDWLSGLLDAYQPGPGIVVVRDLRCGATVNLDPERLQRAVLNVLDNACQAMREPPAAARAGARRLSVATRRADGRIEIRIEDTGGGIPPETLAQVFEPLFSTRNFGVGLGLPIVRQLIEQHGGGIEIESREGEGTLAVLWLPVGVASSAAA